MWSCHRCHKSTDADFATVSPEEGDTGRGWRKGPQQHSTSSRQAAGRASAPVKSRWWVHRPLTILFSVHMNYFLIKTRKFLELLLTRAPSLNSFLLYSTNGSIFPSTRLSASHFPNPVIWMKIVLFFFQTFCVLNHQVWPTFPPLICYHLEKKKEKLSNDSFSNTHLRQQAIIYWVSPHV